MNEERLIRYIKQGNYEKVHELCKRGVDVEYNYNEPIYIAIENEQYDIMELLLKYGADVYAYDRNGENALYTIMEKDDELEELFNNNHDLYMEDPLTIFLDKYRIDDYHNIKLSEVVGYLNNQYI